MSTDEHTSAGGPAAAPGADAIDILIEDARWHDIPEAAKLVRTAAHAALAVQGLSAKASGLSVLLADDARLHALNRQWRGKDRPTNVLSFPAAGPAAGPGDDGETHLGDIAVSLDTLAREAAAEDKPLADHLRHLVVHGVLHLLGFDHMTDAEAEEMEARERAILARLGVPDPYGPDGIGADETGADAGGTREQGA